VPLKLDAFYRFEAGTLEAQLSSPGGEHAHGVRRLAVEPGVEGARVGGRRT
jgi:hypothetical protein